MSLGTALGRLERDLGDLLARHERGRDLTEFERYADDPVGFIQDVLGGDPWSKQIEIASAVRDHPLVVVRGCNSSGKDWVAAGIALWAVYALGALVLITGPTERQVREIVMGEVARFFFAARDLPGELFQGALRLGRAEHAGILALTSTEASRLTGFHAPLVFAVITEAQAVPEFAWEAVLSCATGAEDRVLSVGNPLAPSGRFYAVSRPQSNWQAIRISAEEHPNLAEGWTVIPGGPTQAFVDRIESEYGKTSPIYQARVLGEFPDSGEDSLFRRSWIDRAVERHQSGALRCASEEPVASVDPARFGPDHTVVALSRGPHIERLVSWSQIDLMETVQRVVNVVGDAGIAPARSVGDDERLQQYALEDRLRYGRTSQVWGPRGRIVVDEVGIGSGVVDRLVELGYCVEPFNGGQAPWSASDREKFANRRAESYWRLRQLLEAGDLALPPDEDLTDELLATTWRPTAEGKIALPPKERIKGVIGRSPDKADAVSMAAWWWWQVREGRWEYGPAAWGEPVKA